MNGANGDQTGLVPLRPGDRGPLLSAAWRPRSPPSSSYGLTVGFRHQVRPVARTEYVGADILELTGYAPDEFQADPELLFRLVHPDDRSLAGALDTRLGGPQHLIERVVRRDGRVLWVELRTNPRHRGDGTEVLEGNLRDVSGRCELANQPAAAADHLRAFAERVGDVLFRRTLAPAPALEYVSPGVARLTGYTPEELMGNPLLAAPYFESETPPDLSAEASTSTRLSRWTRKDGSQLWVESRAWPILGPDGVRVGVEGIARDVTDRVRTEEQLRLSEKSFRSLIERLPDALVVYREGRIVYVNEAFCTLVRRPKGDLTEHPVLDLIPPESRGRVEAAAREALAGDQSQRFREFRMLRPDGSSLPVEANQVRITFDGKRAVVSIVRDLTDRRELQTRLQLADRMASVGTLAAGVAHEINNPLAFVMVNQAFISEQLDRLAHQISPDLARDVQLEEVRQALTEAREGSQRVREIVGELKTFSRVDDDKRGPVNVSRVVETCVHMAWNEIRHRARLVKEFEHEGVVEANEARLGQVFLNLLVNAAQSIGEGHADQNEIRVTVRPEGSAWTAVVVRDTGSGIPAAVLPRIFDPFFTTKPVGVGTGLGLSICHSIVTGLGGSIQVESVEGKGSTFTVLLPRRVAVEAVPLPRPLNRPPAPQRARVLVIDDEVAVGTALRRILRRDFEVEHVLSAREALERIRRKPYDAMLCDLMMPDMTGMDLYDELQRTLPGEIAKIVFFTGGAFTQGARAFLERVPNLRLEKPFETVQVERALQDVILGVAPDDA